MAISQNDRNTRITQKAFEVVGGVTNRYGKSQKIITLKQYVPSNEVPSCFNQNSYDYGGPGFYTVKEVTSTIVARRVRFQSSDESTIVKPIVGRIHFGDARPFIGHDGRFERSNERAINCDEAFQRYGGLLMKEFRY